MLFFSVYWCMLCLVRYLFVISTSVIDCLGRFVPEMTYYVSSGMLNLAQLNSCLLKCTLGHRLADCIQHAYNSFWCLILVVQTIVVVQSINLWTWQLAMCWEWTVVTHFLKWSVFLGPPLWSILLFLLRENAALPVRTRWSQLTADELMVCVAVAAASVPVVDQLLRGYLDICTRWTFPCYHYSNVENTS